MPSCPDCDLPYQERPPNFCPNCGHQFVRAFGRQFLKGTNGQIAPTLTGYYLVFFTVALLFYPAIQDTGLFSPVVSFAISIISGITIASLMIFFIERLTPRIRGRT